ncbi:hypothetical protein KKF84_15585 [Myxococcota bacterium]|nr:hypothetical protein [Myxococcota bacterium]MBU1536746.1 hypothetical protein [Myxococcota bacterium]
MWGIAGFSFSLLGFVLFFIPLPLPLFVAPAVSLSGMAIALSQKKPTASEKKLNRITIILSIATALITTIYYTALTLGLSVL